MIGPEINEKWIAEQLARFPAGAMTEAVRLLRAFERADRHAAVAGHSVQGRAA